MKILGMGLPELSMLFLFSLVIAIVFCVICLKIGANKGYNPALCGVLGFFLGVIGLIVVAVLPNKKIDQAIMQSTEADSLMKYKELLDQGIITQEEFDRKKNEILG